MIMQDTTRPSLRLTLSALPVIFLSVAAAAAAAPSPTDAVAFDPARVGSGELLWKSPRGLIPLPVVDIHVELLVTGMIGRGRVRHTFINPTGHAIEAVYVFPLPERAAVDAMEMEIGDRRIVAMVRERQKARAMYESARREGRVTSLLDQLRPNLFKSSVANIHPGETVVVRLEFLQEIGYQDGVFGLVFPLTYTPRYDPAARRPTDRGGRPEPSRRGPATVDHAGLRLDGPSAEERGPSVPGATVEVRIAPGLRLESVHSPSHPLRVAKEGPVWSVALEGSPIDADRDLVLNWRVERDETPSGVVFVEDLDGERYAFAMLLPPDTGSEPGWGLPTETLYIIDVSGSMGGPSIDQARQALLRALDRLRPGDTFNILKFNHRNEFFREFFVSPVGTIGDEARAWVTALEASGGTEILPALKRGLVMMAGADPWPAQRIVLITDGAVANETETFDEVVRRLGRARLHMIGIGRAPNRYLMRKLARFGRGWCEFIGSPDEVEERMESFLGKIDRPVMTDLALEWSGALPEAYPERLPDLYAGEPLFVALRLDRAFASPRVTMRGRLDDEPIAIELAIARDAPPGSGVATRWAREKVASLTDSLHEGADAESVRQTVIALAKRFNLVTPYTSLVAVDHFGSVDRALALPQGGTFWPFLLLLGFLLTSAGVVLGLLLRLTQARRR